MGRAFAEPIGTAETIACYIGKLADQLCASLEQKGLGVRRLDLICDRVDNRAQAVRVGAGLSLRDTKRRPLLGLSRWRRRRPLTGSQRWFLHGIFG